MGVHDCVHVTRAYKLGLVMGQRIDIRPTVSQYIDDIDIIARLRASRSHRFRSAPDVPDRQTDSYALMFL